MNRGGFTLVEVVIGMLLFSVGVLALASSTGFVSMQLQAADLRTERNIAYQQATEQLYITPFDDIENRTAGDAVEVGAYEVWWDVESLSWSLKEVQLYSEGPGFRDRARQAAVQDTLVIRIARPYE